MNDRSQPQVLQQNYGFYFLVDQQIFREDDAKLRQGLIPFAGVTFAPADINTFPFFFLAGIVYHGPVPARDRDTAGLSLAYGQFSHDLQRLRMERSAILWAIEVLTRNEELANTHLPPLYSTPAIGRERGEKT